MVILKLCAAGGTFVTDKCAELADFFDMCGFHFHEACSFFANAGTSHHHFDVVFPCRNVWFFQTKFNAFVTRLCAFIAFIDAGLIFVSAVCYNSHS
jgi:hypothetical protein